MSASVISRPDRARRNATLARAMLAECRFCAHDCGVNRLAHPAGRCHAGVDTRCFCAQVEVTDELELIPTYAVAFSGCDLRCAFCITGAESWDARAGESFDAAQTATRAIEALDGGARTVMVLGGEPTVNLHAALDLVALLPPDARLVWKTNAHGSGHARALLEGMFDVWLADFKFGNDGCAQALAQIPNYTAVVRENLCWAAQHSELIVRHLLMPGHLECCWRPVAKWLAAELPGVKTNLREGFWPAWHARDRAGLRGTVPSNESKAAFDLARQLGLNLIP